MKFTCWSTVWMFAETIGKSSSLDAALTAKL